MKNDQKPMDHILALFEQRRSWPDDAIVEELVTLAVLPDEDDPAWDDERTWREHADLYVALADVAAARRLRPALRLLLERASYGDPGEMMRGLRHSLEEIVAPDWQVLTDACMEATTYPQRGARLWAVSELGVLRDARALQTLIDALNDPADEVRLMACKSLKMVCQTNPLCRAPATEALTRYVSEQRHAAEQNAGREALAEIENTH